MPLFARMRQRRSNAERRYNDAMAFLGSMSKADLADIGIKPADFPRIARDMAARDRP